LHVWQSDSTQAIWRKCPDRGWLDTACALLIVRMA
jgi:hypothetical protein